MRAKGTRLPFSRFRRSDFSAGPALANTRQPCGVHTPFGAGMGIPSLESGESTPHATRCDARCLRCVVHNSWISMDASILDDDLHCEEGA